MKRRIRPFPIALLLVILILLGCFIGYTVKTVKSKFVCKFLQVIIP